MLVLTRKKSETIQIGDNILIKVIRTGSGSVKIGIEAPEDVRVLRGELINTAQEETMKTSRTSLFQIEKNDSPELKSITSDQFPHTSMLNNAL